MRTGIANLPLHPGKCPKWLFPRMRDLSGAIVEAIALEYGRDEVLRRLSDPFFFQSLGCVVGFDWHTSGLTTTLCAALKEGVDPQETGIAVLGGKGKTSRKTPKEIDGLYETFPLQTGKIGELKYASRMAAKVDSVCIQDAYQLYHHSFFVSERGDWCVIQQGLNPGNRYPMRYHWLSDTITSFVEEPHSGIAAESREQDVLNMVARESGDSRKASVDLVKESPTRLERILTRGQSFLTDFRSGGFPELEMRRSHFIPGMDKRNLETLRRAHEVQPKDYEELLSLPGVGPKTVRALALIGQIVYGAEPSWRDPAKFSFSHGGKDGIPYPVDRAGYDRSIGILKTGLQEAKIGNREKMAAIKRLSTLY